MKWPFADKPKKPQQNAAAAPAVTVDASGDRSIAIATQGGPFMGVASTGDNTTIVQVPPGELRPPTEVDAPRGLVKLPARHTAFVGRGRELKLLDTALDGAGTVVVQALHGLGGVGKSALAAHWAATRTSRNNPVWWITADTPADVDAGLAGLATALQPALAQLPQDQLSERAVQWLATHHSWLLVLDNVDNPAHVQPLLARATTGRILITSRRSFGWHDTATPIPLDILTPAEALDLLTRILARNNRTPALDGAAQLCEELGHLPLAVEQAGAYITEASLPPRAYLRLLADYPADTYREAAEGHDSERTIARIWRITLDRLTDTPLAGQILRILAWYAPDTIPRTLLDPLDTPPAVQRAIRRLAAYSMITTNGDTLTVHRLVQALARTPDTDDPHRQPSDITAALHQATTCLHTALPATSNTPATWPTWRTLLPHIDALADHAPADTDTATTADLLNRTGIFLDSQGQPTRATTHLQRALTDQTRVLGADHPSTLGSRNNLAGAYQSAGDLGRAIPLYEQTLEDMVRVLGADHPDTLTSRNNLAYAYESAGDLGRAIPLYEQTLTDRTRVLGADHPDTLTSRNNLAGAYESAGDLGRAIPLYEQTLEDMVRVLGADHPDTLTSRNNLAYAYRSARRLLEAIAMYQRTLQDMVRVLGEGHPSTLTTRNNLASALAKRAVDGPKRW
jgi:tetratricopeptide (TPR) repeat protein